MFSVRFHGHERARRRRNVFQRRGAGDGADATVRVPPRRVLVVRDAAGRPRASASRRRDAVFVDPRDDVDVRRADDVYRARVGVRGDGETHGGVRARVRRFASLASTRRRRRRARESDERDDAIYVSRALRSGRGDGRRERRDVSIRVSARASTRRRLPKTAAVDDGGEYHESRARVRPRRRRRARRRGLHRDVATRARRVRGDVRARGRGVAGQRVDVFGGDASRRRARLSISTRSRRGARHRVRAVAARARVSPSPASCRGDDARCDRPARLRLRLRLGRRRRLRNASRSLRRRRPTER